MNTIHEFANKEHVNIFKSNDLQVIKQMINRICASGIGNHSNNFFLQAVQFLQITCIVWPADNITIDQVWIYEWMSVNKAFCLNNVGLLLSYQYLW